MFKKSPRENTSFSQKNDQLTEKEMSYKSEERGVQPSQALTQEIAAVEQLFKSQLDALPEIVHIWGEKFLEVMKIFVFVLKVSKEKWLLDYLSKEEMKRILQKFKQHQGNQVTGLNLLIPYKGL